MRKCHVCLLELLSLFVKVHDVVCSLSEGCLAFI
jgi:hypothetical protein